MSGLKSNQLFLAVLRTLVLFGVATVVGLAMGSSLGRAEVSAAPIGVVLGMVSYFRGKGRAAQADREG